MRATRSLFALSAIACAAMGSRNLLQEGEPGAAGGAAATTATTKPVKEIRDYTKDMPQGMAPAVFHFRKETIKDPETDQVITESYKHPSLKVPLPVPTKEELLAIFTAPSEGEGNRASEQKYLLDLVSSAFYDQAREQINEFREDKANVGKEVTADALDYNKISITALANMPASERGNKPTDEEMKDFISDYVAVMSAGTQYGAAKIKAQVGVLEKQLAQVKTAKPVLEAFNLLLNQWAELTTKEAVSENQKVYDFLMARIKKWLAKEPTNLLADII